MAGALTAGCTSPATDKKAAPSREEKPEEEKEPVTILAAAAASLEYSFEEELIPMFQDKYPNIKVEGTYDSSGKLQTQIEEGLEADFFMSAAAKQMQTLIDEGLADGDSVTDLLLNKIVLITSSDSDLELQDFTDIANAETIAVGDPESVPAGQYAKEALTNLGIWDKVSARASLGTNVTEALNWVAEGSADAGIVYATDAAATDKVKVVASAPDDSLNEAPVYPAGLLSGTAHKEEAALFLEFLKSEGALAVFEAYGFTPNL